MISWHTPIITRWQYYNEKAKRHLDNSLLQLQFFDSVKLSDQINLAELSNGFPFHTMRVGQSYRSIRLLPSWISHCNTEVIIPTVRFWSLTVSFCRFSTQKTTNHHGTNHAVNLMLFLCVLKKSNQESFGAAKQVVPISSGGRVIPTAQNLWTSQDWEWN